MECFIGNFDGCDSLAISCSKCASSKLVFEASILGATCILRITQQNLPRTEVNTYIPFRFSAVSLDYPHTASIFRFRNASQNP